MTDEATRDETVDPDEIDTDDEIDEPVVEPKPKDPVRIWTLIRGVLVADQLRRVAVDVRRAHLDPHRRRRADLSIC